MGLGSKGISNDQSLQNVIVIILYHVQFFHGTSTFNRSNVMSKSNYNDVIFLVYMNVDLIHKPRHDNVVPDAQSRRENFKPCIQPKSCS
jgi:hypothetical protein